jgi:chemotaxis protein methyltransferase CheR
MVKFQAINLLDDFSRFGMFDVVFCRNVLIYFDQATKSDVLGRIAAVTEADGFLALGGAETVIGLTDRFKPIPDKRGLYAPHCAAAEQSNVISLVPAVASLATAAARR